MNYLDEIDDNLPSYIHPWMPSIKATKKRQEEEKALKVKEEEKEEAQGSSDEGGPSGGTPSDARGPDHQFPEKPDSDSDSCPPTPARVEHFVILGKLVFAITSKILRILIEY